MFSIKRHDKTVIYGAMYVNGTWKGQADNRLIEVENPATGAVIATIPDGTAQDAHDALEAARRAQLAWAALPAIQRANLVSRLAREVEDNADQIALIVTSEQGKPLSEAKGEVSATVNFLRYAAESARRIEGDIVTSDNPGEEIHIRRHPYGVVVGLTAWNYPVALAARKLGPALVAGNTFVLLAHENTPLSGLELARLSEEAGFPKGVLNVVTGRGRTVGKAMVESPMTGLVTMTGSTRAGQEIFRAASENLTVLRLELGG
ncbi:MAG: aldehyde dehydrogenase family protein, partial [Methyloligellaceae bacterium]